MNRSLRHFLVLGAALAAAGAGGGAPPGQTSAPPAGEASAGPSAAPGQINGAGATFPNPIYSKWFSEYNKRHPDVRINYQPIGSGGGIRQLTNRTVFFGASDGPMTDEQLKAAPAPIVHLPTVLGGVVPAYNLPGVTAELRFTGPLLADIYLGKVKKWNDPALAKENPGVKLPANPADKERARIMVEFMNGHAPTARSTRPSSATRRCPRRWSASSSKA